MVMVFEFFPILPIVRFISVANTFDMYFRKNLDTKNRCQRRLNLEIKIDVEKEKRIKEMSLLLEVYPFIFYMYISRVRSSRRVQRTEIYSNTETWDVLSKPAPIVLE